MLPRLVRSEAGAERRDLEEHAARLAEVDRPEVEAIDHRRRRGTGLQNPLAPGLVVFHGRGPGDVVDRPSPADAVLGGYVISVEGSAVVAAHLPAVPHVVGCKAERVLEEALAAGRVVGVGADAVEAL